MPASHEQLMRNARFVFHGTVQQVKGGAVPGMTGLSAAVVRVDQIVQGPEKLNPFEGRNVSVVLPKGQRVRSGQHAVFYTSGAYLGDTLAVDAIGVRPLGFAAGAARGAVAAAAAVGVARPDEALERRDLENRLQSADMVVTGRVSTIRVPAAERIAARGVAAAAAAPAVRVPISEHNPDWREAVIEVDRVGLGGKRKQVVVKFPASDDVRWYRAPKFTPGQHGVFILHRTEPPARTRALGVAAAAALPEEGGFTALHPADVQPAERQEEIDTLVRGAVPLGAAKTVARKAAATKRAAKTAARKTVAKSAVANRSGLKRRAATKKNIASARPAATKAKKTSKAAAKRTVAKRTAAMKRRSR